MKEVEVKARLRNESEVIRKLEELGVQLSEPITQEDKVYFPVGAVFAEEGNKDPALRIRDQNGRYIFTYKKPDKNNLDKIEFESEITDPEEMAKMCEALGFELRTQIKKTRRKAKYNEYEICLDEVDQLGSFIEAESLFEDGDSEHIQKELFSFLETLGVTKEDQVFEGYDIMLYKLQNK